VANLSLQILLINCIFGKSLKLDIVWDHSDMKFNVFYSTFTNVFFILVTFLRFLTF